MDCNSQMNTILRIIDLVRSLQLQDIILLSRIYSIKKMIIFSVEDRDNMNVTILLTFYPCLNRRYVKLIPLNKLMFNYVNPFPRQGEISSLNIVVGDTNTELISIYLQEEYSNDIPIKRYIITKNYDDEGKEGCTTLDMQHPDHYSGTMTMSDIGSITLNMFSIDNEPIRVIDVSVLYGAITSDQNIIMIIVSDDKKSLTYQERNGIVRETLDDTSADNKRLKIALNLYMKMMK